MSRGLWVVRRISGVGGSRSCVVDCGSWVVRERLTNLATFSKII